MANVATYLDWYNLDSRTLNAARDRVVRRKEEQKLAALIHSPLNLSSLKFEQKVTVDTDISDARKLNKELPPDLFSTRDIVKPREKPKSKKYQKMLKTTIFPATKSEPVMMTKKDVKMPKVQKIPENKEDKIPHQLYPLYENNWDVSTMNKLSRNCARWIVHELMRGQVGGQREKLLKNNIEKHGNTVSTTELLPETVSETDLQDFYQNCRDFGIDLSRLNQQQLNRLVSASEKITLKDFAWNRVEKLQSIEIKDDILALNRTCQNIEIKPFRVKSSGKKCVDLLNPKLRKIQNRLPPNMEKYIPKIIPVDECPKEDKVNIDQHLKNDEPIISIALKNWQGSWNSAEKWKELTIEDIRNSLGTIQEDVREDGISSLAIAIIQGRQTRGLDDNTELPLPYGLKEKIIEHLDDPVRRIRIGACSCIQSIPVAGYEDKINEILNEVLDNDTENPNTFFASILLTLSNSVRVNAKICESIMRGYLLEPKPYLLKLLANLSSLGTDLVHSVVSEYLNSGTYQEQCAACTVIGHLDVANLNATVVEKLVNLAWNDKQPKVRSSAIAALGRTGSHDKVMEYVHNELVESLNTENMSYVTLKALEWIEDVGVVTERILHAILACFASPYGSVRGKVCNTIGRLQITDTSVIDELLALIQYEPIPQIKGAAIDALADIGKTNDAIQACLTWSVRFEDDPSVRCAAAKTILHLNIFNNEQVVCVVKERIVVEPDKAVQDILKTILHQLNLTVSQVLEQHPLLVQIKGDIRTLCQAENVIPHIMAAYKK